MKALPGVFLLYLFLAATCLADQVLILAPTVYGGAGSPEALVATSLGYTVDVVDETVWGKMTTTDFSKYRAIILGDPSCGDLPALDAATANASTWSAAVNGNIIIIGTDPTVHLPAGSVLTTNGIRFATQQSGKTGLYMTLSCYYWSSPVVPVAALSAFGTFDIGTVGDCYNSAHIVASSPVMSDLNDGVLSDWSCSVHEGFTAWPASFIPIAIAENAGNIYTGLDASVGTPYILASGAGLVQYEDRILLTPHTASNPTNSQHTVCATVTESGVPAVGATVNFTITAGPNTGVTGTGTTDASGKACFTYTGLGGVGTDTINATATDALSQPVVALPEPASKTWFDPCGPSPLTAVLGSVPCGTNVVIVNFNEIIEPTDALNPLNYLFNNGLNVTGVSWVPGSQSAVAVQASANFSYGTTYSITITGMQNLCGRTMSPDPLTLFFGCQEPCPGVICPSNIVAQCSGPGGAVVNFEVLPTPGCSNETVYTYPPSGSLFPPGVTTVFSTASLGGGTNGTSNSCSFTVTVTDSVPPVIQCPASMVITTGCPTISVPFNVGVTDNCCLHPTLVSTPASGSTFNAGTTTQVNCVATDCNGNTNGCSFSIQVVLNPNSVPPVITSFPTNYVICYSNGCGVMPDLTSQVEVSAGGDTIYITQSIPPGTVLCSNSTVIFTAKNACGSSVTSTGTVTLGPCTCYPLVKVSWPSALTNIIVWEGDGVEQAYNFPISPLDPRLQAIPGGPTPANFDFLDPNGRRFYDVYLSDSNGNPTNDGCCISIVCNMLDANSNYDSGNNIDAVELQFADNTVEGASSVGSVMLGQNLTDPNLVYTSGLATNALGLPDGAVTYLGSGLSRITLCFADPANPSISTSPVLPPPIAPYILMKMTWYDPFVRPWVVESSTDFVTWTETPFTNSPAVITNTIPPQMQFYRLKLVH